MPCEVKISAEIDAIALFSVFQSQEMMALDPLPLVCVSAFRVYLNKIHLDY